MKINWILLGDRNVASSRCRGWKIGEELRKRNHEVHFNKCDLNCDCLIVQKRGDLINLLERHPNSVFDFDDIHNVSILNRNIRAAKKITVGAVSLKRYCPSATYIPDCLDRDGDVEKIDYRKTGKLIWFGNPNNCWMLERYGGAFMDWKLVIITDFKHRLYRFQGIAELKMWRLETVDSEIIQGDIVILPYNLEQEKSRIKGANKLLKSWSLGMPVVASPTEECKMVSEDSGIDCLAGENLDEWRNLLERLENENLRREWGQRGKVYSQQFKAEFIADQWEEVIQAEVIR